MRCVQKVLLDNHVSKIRKLKIWGKSVKRKFDKTHREERRTHTHTQTRYANDTMDHVLKAKEAAQPHLNKLEHYLNTSTDPFASLIAKVSEKTGVARLHLVLGVVGIVLVYVIFDQASRLLGGTLGFAYPAYRSFKAIESSHKEDDTQWLVYWVVFASFSIVEIGADLILFWFPFYYLAKLAFLLWCMYPGESNGSAFIYTHVVRKFLIKHESRIDNAASSAHQYVAGATKKE
eukprot:m.477171 g.477171  ORF g.477171 m.477171 type:complete len:233 (-) comp20764_c0_seq1:181-879(-)